MIEHTGQCHACGTALRFEGRVRRDEGCPQCHADVHSCLNCAFYDAYAHNQCREPAADWVTDREKANYCDYFTLGRKSQGRYAQSAEESKRRLEALFGPKKGGG